MPDKRQKIAVIGSGISALSAAWLLSRTHSVTVFEKAERLGGHSNTVTVRTATGEVDVDTGFIVFNDRTYPNLVALFDHLGVESERSAMSFAASMDGGRFEYSSEAILAQPSNLVRPRFWSMLSQIMRFYKVAPADVAAIDDPSVSLGDYLKSRGFSAALKDDHLLPMAAAIWSSPVADLMDYPAESFIKFCGNHGLLSLNDRPKWRTVTGGSRVYVERIARELDDVRLNADVKSVKREKGGVIVATADGHAEWFDQVVVGAHANQALAMLDQPTADERRLLGAFRYSRNVTLLHTDAGLMPKRKSAWASWNYIGGEHGLCVSYWMNQLQGLPGEDLFVTLNPPRAPAAGTLLRTETYEHPIFDAAAVRAQREMWDLQGVGGVWFCGAHFGAGFHEDGLQSGLAVAEQIGGLKRPWMVQDESGRIHVRTPQPERVAA